jgi:UPF0755 protein
MLETVPRRSHRRPLRRRNRRDGERGRWRGLVGLAIFVLILAGLLSPLGWFWREIGAEGQQQQVTFTIERGATGNEVAEQLESEGIIRSATAFRLLARIRSAPLAFEAGQYEMFTNMRAGDALDLLNKGPVVEPGIRVNFPEGYRLEQFAQRAAEDLELDQDELKRLASRKGKGFYLPDQIAEDTGSVEGFLFPSTYEFAKEATERDVIQRLLDQFKNEVQGMPWENAEELGVTPYQVVTIASMIEREAKFDDERAKIAAVIYNRLEKGMALQIDATVQYALGNWKPILIKDRDVDSPYNTYIHTGVPPGPICNPGLASITAALNPEDVDFLYYVVTDAEGHHEFTADYNEFLRLVEKYQG